MTARARRHTAQSGFTLIEIMIVVLLGALMMSGAAVSFSAVRRGRARAAAARVASAFRFGYIHALTTGRPTRVVFALGANRVWIEDTEDAHVLDTHDPMHAGGAAVSAEAMEEVARREASNMSSLRPRAPRAEFARPAGQRYRVRELEGATFTKLYAAHESDARTEGEGFVYFFPGGVGERAVIQLRGDDESVFSIAVSALSGHAEIFDHAVEPPAIEEQEPNDQTEVDVRDQRLQESPE